MKGRGGAGWHRVITPCGLVLSLGVLLTTTQSAASAPPGPTVPAAVAAATPQPAPAASATLPRQSPATSAAQSPATSAATVEVTLPQAELTVGEPAELRLTVRVPAAQLAEDPRFPPWREAWGDAEVREHDEPARAAAPGGITVFTERLVVAAFKTGRIDLPRLPIAVPLRTGTVTAWTPDHLALAVRSVLPAAATGASGSDSLKPRPPAPLRPLPLGRPFYITLAALAAAALGGAWLLWRRHRRHTAGDAAAAGTRPALAPYPELLAALDRLDAEPDAGLAPAAPSLASGAAPAVPAGASPAQLALHTGLSQALRRYLGRTLDFPAPESTTSEIQRRLLALGWTSTQVRAAAEVLRACDMVKFARAGAAARGRERLVAVRRLAADCEAERAAATAAAIAAATDAVPPLEAAG